MSFSITVQPPRQAQRGKYLDPPLALKFRLSSINGSTAVVDMSRLCALASLVNDRNEILGGGLAGNCAESAQNLFSDNGSLSSSRGYFLFDSLRIQVPGKHRIRVTFVRMDENGGYATSLSQVDSHTVDVRDGNVARHSPSADERRFLNSLP